MLSTIEARVIGSLLEKERTVPDQYPLTLNALVTACNQATSREPVMRLDDADVELAIASLKVGGWLRIVHPSHGRSVTRYRQVADEKLSLEPPHAALMAVLLLRGAQTSAELRSRTERQHSFASVTEVDGELQAMADLGLVQRLDRQPGQKEQRWKQLIADEPEYTVPSAATVVAAPSGAVADRLAQLEARVARLEAALGDLLGDEPTDTSDDGSGPGPRDPDTGV
jgi:uncharacterized protein YceH (UPF0502 family)